MPRAFWVGAVVAVCASPVSAQDVRWRHDFAAARKEAEASGKTLLLDFGTESCLWCKKLDATTFRDRGIAESLNANFIPVKVDAEREARLTQSAGVQAYPTVVLVSPDGKIVARHEGYADVAKMTALLRQAPRPTPKPAAAVVQVSAASVQTPADQLALARADHDAGRYLTCIERCDRILATNATSREAVEARKLSAAITGDPAKWKKVTVQLEADLAVVKRDLDAALGR